MIGTEIKTYLDKYGIKYSHVSEKTGIPMNILSPILNGKREIKAEEYFAICDALSVSLERFADREAGMELDFETLVCIAQHIGVFFNQCTEERKANWCEPCVNCRCAEKCGCDWYGKLKPIFDRSHVPIKLCS